MNVHEQHLLGASSILSWESLDRELASPLVSSFYRLELELFIFMHRSSRNRITVVYELMSLAGKNKKEMPETTTSSRFHGFAICFPWTNTNLLCWLPDAYSYDVAFWPLVVFVLTGQKMSS